MQSDVNFPLVLCKPSSQIIQPKFNQCKRFVLHPHFPFIYLTISILGSSIIFGLSLKYTLRFVPSNLLLITPKHQNYIDPESSNFGNDISSEFGETMGSVSTRNYGINLKVVF